MKKDNVETDITENVKNNATDKEYLKEGSFSTEALDKTTTYSTKCSDGLTYTPSVIGEDSMPTPLCQGTVAGSYSSTQMPGPYEGYDCSYFTTESSCLQGWKTHGCAWNYTLADKPI
ncbi:MAG TPA: hypothetical protein DHV48_05275 [Prolixibacteraceae bacterium]|nr:hypothetical protein [Prolixibacteraceae bacterium]